MNPRAIDQGGSGRPPARRVGGKATKSRVLADPAEPGQLGCSSRDSVAEARSPGRFSVWLWTYSRSQRRERAS